MKAAISLVPASDFLSQLYYQLSANFLSLMNLLSHCFLEVD